jgi:hypothetical protein
LLNEKKFLNIVGTTPPSQVCITSRIKPDTCKA